MVKPGWHLASGSLLFTSRRRCWERYLKQFVEKLAALPFCLLRDLRALSHKFQPLLLSLPITTTVSASPESGLAQPVSFLRPVRFHPGLLTALALREDCLSPRNSDKRILFISPEGPCKVFRQQSKETVPTSSAVVPVGGGRAPGHRVGAGEGQHGRGRLPL